MTNIEVIDYARSLLNEPLASTRTFPDDSSSFWADTTLMKYGNAVIKEIANVLNQSYENYFTTNTTISLVAGCATYSLPSNFLKMVRVETNTNPNNPLEIKPISFNEKENNTNWNLATYNNQGKVSQYTLVGDKILFRPIPISAETSGIMLWYIPRVSEMVSATDTCDIPAEYHELIAWGIVRKAQFQMEADTSVATIEYNRLMKDMKMYIEDRTIQRTRIVKRTKRYRG